MNDAKKILSFRASDGNTLKMEYYASLPSSSQLAREYAQAGYPDRYVVFTERQTAVGSLGNSLSDGESEKGIYLSCILRPSIFPSQVGAIGPLSALSLATTLEEHSDNIIGIGWVSDIYCNGEKIGCSSVEGKLDNFNSYEYLIVNFYAKLDTRAFPHRLTDILRQVFEEESYTVPIIMAKSLLNKFFGMYKELKTPDKHLTGYLAKFILQDMKIKYLEGGKKKTGRVVGIDKESLALLIEAKDGRHISISSPSGVIIPNKI